MLERSKALFHAKALLYKLLEDNNLNAQTLELTYNKLVEQYGKELADIAFNNAIVSIIIYIKRKGISEEQLDTTMKDINSKPTNVLLDEGSSRDKQIGK
jgi:hypothetical protein